MKSGSSKLKRRGKGNQTRRNTIKMRRTRKINKGAPKKNGSRKNKSKRPATTSLPAYHPRKIECVILDTDIGYDPDDIPAVVMVMKWCTDHNKHGLIVTSAEVYDSAKQDIGRRARTVRVIAARYARQGVKIAQSLDDWKPGTILIVSGDVGSPMDHGAAKSRQYNDFLVQRGLKYHQSLVPHLWDAVQRDEGGTYPNDIVGRQEAISTLKTAVENMHTTWISIGAMPNLYNLLEAGADTSKVTVFQQGLNVPILKKHTSTNMFLDANDEYKVNRKFKGDLFFIGPGLTSNYEWLRDTRFKKTEAADHAFAFMKAGYALTKPIRDLVDANNAAAVKKEWLKYIKNPNGKNVVSIYAAEQFGREANRGLFVIGSPNHDFILGKNMPPEMQRITINKIKAALRRMNANTATILKVDNFVRDVSDNKDMSAYRGLGKLIYPKPTQVWPFNSCFHDPITVWYALCSDVFTTLGGGGLIPLSSLKLSPGAALQELVLIGNTKPGDVKTIIRNEGDAANFKRKGRTWRYNPTRLEMKLTNETRFNDLWLLKCKPKLRFDDFSFTLKNGGAVPQKGKGRRFFTARLFTDAEANSVATFVKGGDRKR
jgi:hypothetical protein